MTEASGSGGKELFIVDNSVSGWTGLRYLKEWTEVARSFDIATGFFEIGSLLALDGQWQKLDEVRILMGSEMTHRTRRALLSSVVDQAVDALDESLESEKEPNPFLKGVEAILAALQKGQIKCRVYDKAKFHAKTYITHGRLEVVGSQALVGSSNFTLPGLTRNIELNVQIQSAREVAQLQEWFETHWDEATDVTPTIAKTVERHIREHVPFHIYAKALQEFFRGHELTSSEWDETASKMFPVLDRYQKEAYWALMKIVHQHQGAFLCDGVGLGKTFVGLMVIERLILHEGKRVVLLAPKAAKEAVWEPHLRTWLPHIGGVGGNADFSNLAVFSHTDLARKGGFPERFKRMSELADAVIIDEAHHFRNPGRRADDGGDPSRYWRLYDLLDSTVRPKQLFMLTATPINNRISDFRHMTELFSRRDESYFSRSLGVSNLRAHFTILEKQLREQLGSESTALSEHLPESNERLAADEIFQNLVVQRSRAYARASQLQETGDAAAFPERLPPKVAGYSIRKTYGRLLELFETAFAENNLFSLPMYYPLAWYQGSDTTIDPFEENRQRQVVGLIRTLFLKRFESSVAAFEASCDRLLAKLLAFLEVHTETDAELRRLERWKVQHADILGVAYQRQLDLWGDDDASDEEEDIIAAELRAAVVKLDRSDYNLVEMMQETYLDCDQLVAFLAEARRFEPKHDDKLQKLVRLLKSKEVHGQKVLIFSEFAETARYIAHHLREAGVERVQQLDGASKLNRATVIKRFSPYYNDTTSGKLAASGDSEIQVLVSTDVLSEGLNLQDATKMVNYDIHWNPVRLMQRIGRVDRRMNPAVESEIVRDHPSLASTRGTVSFWNFLPPDELNQLLSLYTRVTQKTLLISRTLGIEGRKLFTPDDEFDALREFNHSYEGTKSTVEDMHLEYQQLLKDHPDLEASLAKLPRAAFSGKVVSKPGLRAVFFCFSLPALDRESQEFTYAAGSTRWLLYNLDTNIIVDEPHSMIDLVRSTPTTERSCSISGDELVRARREVEKHLKNSYLKRVDAPVSARPKVACWLDLHGS